LVDLTDVAPLVLETAGVVPAAPLAGSNPVAARVSRDFVRGEAAHIGARFARSLDWLYVSQPFGRDDPRLQLPAGLRDRFRFERTLVPVAKPRDPHSAIRPDPALVATLERAAEPAEAASASVGAANAAAGADLDRKTRDSLRALGYVESPEPGSAP
jgi:hypothetical protein